MDRPVVRRSSSFVLRVSLACWRVLAIGAQRPVMRIVAARWIGLVLSITSATIAIAQEDSAEDLRLEFERMRQDYETRIARIEADQSNFST
ncbi:MAG: hypothetical protein ACR2NZ_09095, partial [Rubripirellula sp.]